MKITENSISFCQNETSEQIPSGLGNALQLDIMVEWCSYVFRVRHFCFKVIVPFHFGPKEKKNKKTMCL